MDPMAYALSARDLPAPKPASRFLQRLVNTIAASRIDAAERELRRHEALLRETALVHGEYRTITLDRAALLPFAA
jgi:hypothetical protein